MKVRDIMTASVDLIDAQDTISYAARRMAEDDVGALPILNDGKLVGIVTDRDIAVRAVAGEIAPDTPVSRIMSTNVSCCSPNDDIETVLALMSREQVRRMPVCNERSSVIGIIALADIAARIPDKKEAIEALAEICARSRFHSQAPLFA